MEWAPFRHSIVGLAVSVLALVLTWVASSSTGPLNVFTLLNLPAMLVGVAVSGNVHQPSLAATYMASFVQWFLIGYAGAWLYDWFRHRAREERSDV